MIEISKISKKGLITIPLRIKEKLGAEEGDFLEWEVKEGYAIVRVIKNPYRLLRGKYKDPELTYEKVEGLADRLLEEEIDANSRTGHVDSVRKSGR